LDYFLDVDLSFQSVSQGLQLMGVGGFTNLTTDNGQANFKTLIDGSILASLNSSDVIGIRTWSTPSDGDEIKVKLTNVKYQLLYK